MLKLTNTEIQWMIAALEDKIAAIEENGGHLHPLGELHRDNLQSVKAKLQAELARRIQRPPKKENTREK
ncbi:hypothetical protein LJC32_01135 [Oscillospiraceae bacterium OttesenSCG-928-F05]|nr:hypothetical protein [Oscillospiraceae bacterium OttesenSCG-928-F05]